MQDTFYVEGGMLLADAYVERPDSRDGKAPPPLAIVCPGKCYRRDDLSVRASPMFTQSEGFMAIKSGASRWRI